MNYKQNFLILIGVGDVNVVSSTFVIASPTTFMPCSVDVGSLLDSDVHLVVLATEKRQQETQTMRLGKDGF